MTRDRAAAVLAVLVLVLAACSRSDPPVPDGTPPEVGRECAPLPVVPGTGPIAWTVTAGEQGFVDNDPVAVGDGILVGVNRCIGFVEPSGRVRWTISGLLVDAARFEDVVVIANHGRQSIVGVRATTGDVVWSRPDRSGWQDVAGDGKAVMLVGSSFDDAVVTLDPATGRGTAALFPGGDNGYFSRVVLDEGLFLTAGIGDRRPLQPRGPVVAADGTGRIVLDSPSGLFAPNPVGLAGDVVVVQSSGTTSAGDGEPSSHFVGLDRATGAVRWRRAAAEGSAGHAVEVAGTVVVRVQDALVGLDARSGVVRWSVPAEADWDSPLVAAGPDAVAIGDRDGTVAVVEVADGRRRWSTRVEGPVAVLGTPDGEVLFAANDPDVYRAYRIGDGTQLWTAHGPAPGAGASRGGKRARLAFADDAAATLAGLTGVVALRLNW